MEWYVPSTISVAELQRTLNVINQFLETPFDLDGKGVSSLLNKKRRRRRRRSPSPDSDEDALLSGDVPRRKKRKEKATKEKAQYKSAQFIEDSDEEYGNMEAFLDKERAQRAKAALAAATAGLTNRPVTMKAAGTKKRRRKAAEGGSKPKRRKSSLPAGDVGDRSESDMDVPNNDSDVELVETVPIQPAESQVSDNVQTTLVPRPRPRPRPRPKTSATSSPLPSEVDDQPGSPSSDGPDGKPERVSSMLHIHRSKRLILSDDDD